MLDIPPATTDDLFKTGHALLKEIGSDVSEAEALITEAQLQLKRGEQPKD